ncbi:MAG: tetratricopeptide repeat protein [Acidobacteriaceae bacterium]
MSEEPTAAVRGGERYERADVLRIVGISGRQLAGWERAGLIAIAESYSFTDLVQLTKLRSLRGHVPSRVILRTLKACSVAGLENPLMESGVVFTAPHRIAVKHQGATLEPASGQFVFDFADAAPSPEGETRGRRVVPIRPDRETVREMFLRGVQLEESADMVAQAMGMYRRLLEIDPHHAPAHINLGTLYYNQQNFTAAEQSYRQAVESDPGYALAYFDLGNVLDETGRVQEAIAAYEQAIELAADYADAHYNVALAYERVKAPRKALSHWQKYVKLDSAGPWSSHARAQAERILQIDQLQIVWRKGS